MKPKFEVGQRVSVTTAPEQTQWPQVFGIVSGIDEKESGYGNGELDYSVEIKDDQGCDQWYCWSKSEHLWRNGGVLFNIMVVA